MIESGGYFKTVQLTRQQNDQKVAEWRSAAKLTSEADVPIGNKLWSLLCMQPLGMDSMFVANWNPSMMELILAASCTRSPYFTVAGVSIKSE